MAKGIEDTAFYVYNRLVSLNEVGGDPGHSASPPAAFHRYNAGPAGELAATRCRRCRRTTPSAARTCAPAQRAVRDARRVARAPCARWTRLNEPHRQRGRGRGRRPTPTRSTCSTRRCSAPGRWSRTLPEDYADVRRAHPGVHGQGAARGQGPHQLDQPQRRLRRGRPASSSPASSIDRRNGAVPRRLPRRSSGGSAIFGLFNSLSQTLLKIASPGVPDIYQGTELWDFSLVDPDNRRPVDYEHRRQMLQDLQTQAAGRPDRKGLARELTGATGGRPDQALRHLAGAAAAAGSTPGCSRPATTIPPRRPGPGRARVRLSSAGRATTWPSWPFPACSRGWCRGRRTFPWAGRCGRTPNSCCPRSTRVCASGMYSRARTLL